jgi:PAS domain S-box-containing protein
MNLETSHSLKAVWVIDDDETALLLAEEVLTDAGFQVATFTNATNALEAAQTILPDIIVVDVIMPGVDGFEFCKRLRSLPRGDVVPILITTSLDDTVSINKAYQAGATNFVTKPLNWIIEVHRLDYMLRSAKNACDLLKKEHETRLAKEDWERTFDSITDVVTVLEMDLKILRANKATCQLFGRASADLVGQECHELFCASAEPCPDCLVTRAQKTNLPASGEIKIGPAGNLFEVTVSPITDPEGQLTHLVMVARDLSEKKKLESELRHAQKMEAIGTLAGGIAHDFNNLLTVIQGCSEILIQHEADAGRSNENLKDIFETARRGAALTKQLLIFSHKNSNGGQKRLLDLNEVLNNISRMLEKGVSKTVAQQYRMAGDLHKIIADSGQIEQVVMNLAVNAAQAMPDGGTLTIETMNVRLETDRCQLHPNLQPGNYVLLTVSDTGQGMDKLTQARMYEPFFTTKKLGEGTGLGLSVVFGIVREHSGQINCCSEVGVGTTFQIYFPAADPEIAALQPVTAAVQTTPNGSETVLVVDDEAPIRGLLERYLTMLGYDVIEAEDGETALRKYTEVRQNPHAVILDLGMPRMSGSECLEKLRILNPQVRVLVASGNGEADLDSHVLKQGALAFLAKPYNLADISEKLRKVLDVPLEKSSAENTPTLP